MLKKIFKPIGGQFFNFGCYLSFQKITELLFTKYMINFITNPAIIWVISVTIGFIAYFVSHHYFKKKDKAITNNLLENRTIPNSNQKEFSNFDYDDLKNMANLDYDNGKFYYTQYKHWGVKNIQEIPLNVDIQNDSRNKGKFFKLPIYDLPKNAKSIFLIFEVLYKDGNNLHNDINLDSIGYIDVKTKGDEIVKLENEEAEIDVLHRKESYPFIEYRLVLNLKLEKELRQKDFFLSIKAKWFKI
jgi:hypothetical protein